MPLRIRLLANSLVLLSGFFILSNPVSSQIKSALYFGLGASTCNWNTFNLVKNRPGFSSDLGFRLELPLNNYFLLNTDLGLRHYSSNSKLAASNEYFDFAGAFIPHFSYATIGLAPGFRIKKFTFFTGLNAAHLVRAVSYVNDRTVDNTTGMVVRDIKRQKNDITGSPPWVLFVQGSLVYQYSPSLAFSIYYSRSISSVFYNNQFHNGEEFTFSNVLFGASYFLFQK